MPQFDDAASFWDGRYAEESYLFGTEPNAFLAREGGRLQPGWHALAVADGTVYAGPSGNDRTPLVALDAPTGERLWERPVSRDVRIAAAGGTLYVGDGDGLLALRD